jgi:hypothetical protein
MNVVVSGECKFMVTLAHELALDGDLRESVSLLTDFVIHQGMHQGSTPGRVGLIDIDARSTHQDRNYASGLS